MKKFTAIVGILLLSLGGIYAEKTGEDKTDVWQWLKQLILLPGVSEHEAKVADFIQAELPKDLKVQRDDMENVWFTVGSGRPHLVFVAHTDELGLVVEKISSEGTLKVSSRGGFITQMYEGRPVVIYTKSGEVNGVVKPRPNYLLRNQEHEALATGELEIYLGVDSEDAARKLGVAEGDFITIKKYIAELTPDLWATRAVDDRAGCAVLMAATFQVDWSQIKRKRITFAWDSQEETGLRGAERLAEILDADAAFAIDTFVSSDAPRDEKRFAQLPLGKGIVIRGVDSSVIVPRVQLKKIIAIAEKHYIPYQLGNTRGSTDGTRFVPAGAVVVPLSWPGAYSHSFIEKVQRQDLEALTDMVLALIEDWK